MTRLGLRRAMTSILAAVFVMPLALPAQQRDPTAPVAAPKGTGEIAGVVMSADATPQPIRRAIVTVSGGGINPRSVLTDDGGRFSLAKLPAGTFTVVARKAAYLAAPYGARRPGRTGMPIALAADQRANVAISMFRGSVIAGTIRDTSGFPVGGVNIRVIDARTLLQSTDSISGDVATTDDRGVFRIFSLLPGDYYVVALPETGGSGEIVAPSAPAIDSALAMLASRRSSPGLPISTVPAVPQRPIGFAPVFYPGTPSYRDAARVRVEPGEERAGVDFAMSSVQMAAIEGTVSGDVPDLSKVQVTIIPSGPRVTTSMSSNSLSGRPIDAQGKFKYTNLPPGSYRLVARASRGDASNATPTTLINGVPAGASGGGGSLQLPAGSSGDFLYGFADVELRGQDITTASLVLQPGGTITGRIVFNGSPTTPKPEDLTKLRASLSLEGGTGMVSANGLMMGNNLLAAPIASVKADGTFEIRGIGPGRFSFNVALGATTTPAEATSWKLRSAVSADRNLLDQVSELGPGVDIRNVLVTFTDARTELSGTLQSATGQVTTEYYIVALPADRSLWRPRSRRILVIRPATDGRFVFADLPAGDYLIAALGDLDPIDLTDTVFLEQVAPSGIKVTVAEGERKVQDLRIR